jgi:hypothetical protein
MEVMTLGTTIKMAPTGLLCSQIAMPLINPKPQSTSQVLASLQLITRIGLQILSRSSVSSRMYHSRLTSQTMDLSELSSLNNQLMVPLVDSGLLNLLLLLGRDKSNGELMK